MGYVYTQPNNAISISNKTLGPIDNKGPKGIPGPNGNPWAVGTNPNPNTLTSFEDKNGDVVPKSGNILAEGDLYLDNVTGAVWKYDGIGTWIIESYNLKGPRGSANYLATEISFSQDKATGWTINIPNIKFLVGHVIYPGSAIAGPISTVQVILNINAGDKAMEVDLYLVNLGTSAGDNLDDIIIAKTTTTRSGNGSISTMAIIDLVVYNSNVPVNAQVFGLFALMKEPDGDIQERLKDITKHYTPELANAYKESIEVGRLEDRNSFYKVLDKSGVQSTSELLVVRKQRQYDEGIATNKRIATTTKLMEDFEKDSESVSGSKPYDSFNRESTTSNENGAPPIELATEFAGEILISHLSIR